MISFAYIPHDSLLITSPSYQDIIEFKEPGPFAQSSFIDGPFPQFRRLELETILNGVDEESDSTPWWLI